MIIDSIAEQLFHRACDISASQVKEWLRERQSNCVRIAMTKNASDRDGWIEDAAYFSKALAIINTDPRIADIPGNPSIDDKTAKAMDEFSRKIKEADSKPGGCPLCGHRHPPDGMCV